MFGAIHKRGWQGVIGLIAAYALVLQAFLAYSIATQAAAHGDSPYSGSFFVICTSQDNAALDGAGVPVKPTTHCPICTLSASAAGTLPNLVSLPTLLPIWQSVSAEQTPFVLGQYATKPHSRGPPTII